jgi:hypothetical protein
MTLSERGQTVRGDDGKLLHKDARILGPVMRSDKRFFPIVESKPVLTHELYQK